MAKCEACKKDTVCEGVDYGEKCIFHCDKSDEEKWGDPESEDVKRFWRAIRQQINDDKNLEEKNHDFSKYHFPVFEESKTIEVKKTTYIDGKNFGLYISKGASFIGAIFYYDAFFAYVVFNDWVVFEDTEFKKSLFFEASIFSKTLTIKPKQQCDLKLNNSIFKEDSRIFITGTFNSLCIDTILNDSSSVKLNDVTVVKKLSMRNFLASDFEFNGLNLKDEAIINLEKVSFRDAHFTQIEWGKINESRFKGDNGKQLDRQMARQLKHINDTQGETVIANDFYALEMGLRSKELKWKRGEISEKIVQNIHGLVSNHSNDWFLPTVWFFAFAFLFATLAKYSTLKEAVVVLLIGIVGLIVCARKITAKNYIFIAIGVLVVSFAVLIDSSATFEFVVALVNPLNFKDSKDLLGDTNLVLVYACRIIEVFIGYQIITAIRKNTRRK